ncbi:hypothetical protein OXYTRIMIC_783 [Oxytricha trifallax]|uniref:Uncharacterized protein n=1 Tax=Oxytricha trifallax TaxID=1172189 RepID=A0A073HYT5_9SPIT|nr:hypothetical protein OXYTRIMIC_783 [Oxytricha trifallax]
MASFKKTSTINLMFQLQLKYTYETFVSLIILCFNRNIEQLLQLIMTKKQVRLAQDFVSMELLKVIRKINFHKCNADNILELEQDQKYQLLQKEKVVIDSVLDALIYKEIELKYKQKDIRNKDQSQQNNQDQSDMSER